MDSRITKDGEKGYLRNWGGKLTNKSLEGAAIFPSTLDQTEIHSQIPSEDLETKLQNKVLQTVKDLTSESIDNNSIFGHNILVYHPQEDNIDEEYRLCFKNVFAATLSLNKILPNIDMLITSSQGNTSIIEELAKRSNTPLKYMRNKKIYDKNDSSSSELVEVTDLKNKRALLVEEILLGNKDTQYAIDAIRKTNGNIAHVVAIFDYNCVRCKDKFNEIEQEKYQHGQIAAPCNLYSIIKYEDAVSMLLEKKIITEETSTHLIDAKNALDDVMMKKYDKKQ